MKFGLMKETRRITGDYWETSAYITLDSYAKDRDGTVLLSPDCRSSREVHSWADGLIKQLQDLKRSATRIKWDGQASRT